MSDRGMFLNSSNKLIHPQQAGRGWGVGGAWEGGDTPGWVRSSERRALIDQLPGRVPGSLPVLSRLIPVINLVRRW